jgi:hypothetical protein
MAFIPVTDGARAVLSFLTVNSIWSLTQYYTKTAFTVADMNDLASQLEVGFAPSLLAGLNNQTTYIQTTVYDMRSETAPKIIATPSVPPVGSRVSNPAPVHTAAVMTLLTNARGKTAQGRNFISGLGEEDVDDDSINSVIQGIFEATYQNELIAINPAGWQFVVASFQENNAPRTVALTRPVIQATIRLRIVGSQRRRIRRN